MARKMKDISGRRCIALYEKSGRDGSLPKMLLAILASVSTKLPHRWKLKASPSGRLLFQLAPLALSTGATDFGLWLTPRARESCEKQESFLKRNGDRTARCHGSLSAQVLWPTPAVRGFTNDGSLAMLKEKCQSREEWAAMAYRAGTSQKQKLWPTPNASDCRDRGNMSQPVIQRRATQGKQLNLSMVVSPTSGQLNPLWVEWLMGYPIGWSACAPSATPSSRKSRNSSGAPSSPTNPPMNEAVS